MITVIVPTLNEEETVGSVVRFALACPGVTEVIVVDDKSSDRTVSVARENGAHVITSTKLGKGASMKDAILCAKNEVLAFLDGDIDPYPPQTIELLTSPILADRADFVKSTFSRNAGRVTELVAKPLLSIFFPELLKFGQPLSGMIAGKKSLFTSLDFSDDYGVDIGILIDMHVQNARIEEVQIGYIENKSKPWQELGKMSKEVAHMIIRKASNSGNTQVNMENLGIINEIRSQMDFPITEQTKKLKKLIVFDLDNTILVGRFIDECAKKFRFKTKLAELRAKETDPVLLTKHIALLLKGVNYGELIQVLDEIPLVKGTEKIMAELKHRGYVTGIISDSYDFVVNHIKNKLGMDFSVGNELEFSKSVCTGEVKIPSHMIKSQKSLNDLPVCKTNALMHIIEKYGIRMKNCIAVGDGLNDLGMIKEAGLGIAFCSPEPLLNYHADVIVSKRSFGGLLKYAL